MSFADPAQHFSNENKAIDFIESLIWPGGPICPYCALTEKQYRIKANPERKVRYGLHKCGACKKQYTVKIGPIFEDSKIPMSKWLMVIYLMCSSKRGISAKHIERTIRVSYKAAWFMCHRIRLAMTQEPLKGKLGSGGGIVEADETFVSGKANNNRHRYRNRNKKKGLFDAASGIRSVEATTGMPTGKNSRIQRLFSQERHART